MRLKSLASILAVLALAVPAITGAAGNNLSWDACGSDGVVLKEFACDRNTGAHVVLGSTRPYTDLPAVVGMSAELDLVVPSTGWPDWWRFFVEGACRRASLSATFLDPAFGAGVCADPWQGRATGIVMSYLLESSWYGLARLQLSSALPTGDSVAVAANEQIYLFTVRFDHQLTVGSGACTGCRLPVCILLRRVTLHQPIGVGDYTYNGPDERDNVFWQSSSLPSGCFVATRNRTWGAIKGMYR